MSTFRPKSIRQLWREHLMNGALAPIIRHPGAVAVYLAYAAHANDEGLAWPANARIARAFGLSVDAITRGRKACIIAGLMVDTGLFQHRCRVYRLPQTIRTDADGQTADVPYPATPSLRTDADRTIRTGVPLPSAPVATSLRTGAANYPHPCGPKVVEGRIESSSKGNAAAGEVPTNADTAALRAALAEARIGGPLLTILAGHPHLTPAIVRQEADKTRERGKDSGILVHNLQARAEAEVSRAARRAKQTAEAMATAAKRQEDQRREAEDAAYWQARYDELSPTDLEGHRQAILAEMSLNQQRLLQPDGPTMQAYVKQRLKCRARGAA